MRIGLMIKCKADLINTYIENDFGELRDLYIKKAIEFGFNHQGRSHKSINWYDLKFIGICDGWGRGRLGQSDSNAGKLDDFECKKLALSDLKPRTRTEYEKVTESIFDLRDEFERGELYAKHKNKEKYHQVNTEQWLVSAINNNNVYRKVEKEIDERQEFVERAMELSKQVDVGQDVEWLGLIYDNLVMTELRGG